MVWLEEEAILEELGTHVTTQWPLILGLEQASIIHQLIHDNHPQRAVLIVANYDHQEMVKRCVVKH